MALPASGPISSSQIATELVVSSASFSANSAELLVYTDLNALSISSSGNILDIDVPNSMSEWYNYTHNFKVSSSVVISSIGLKAPNTASYPFTTFAQVEMGTTSSIFIFTGSNFVSSGLAPTASVPYSIYYAPYSSTMSSSKQLLQSGVLTAASSSGKLDYQYKASSGSIITFLFKITPPPTPVVFPTPYVKYDQYSSSLSATVWTNLGSAGSTYNLKTFNSVIAGGSGTGTYLIFNAGTTVNQYASCSGFDIGAKDFTISTVFRVTKWWDGYATTGCIFGTWDSSFPTTFNGFQIGASSAISSSGPGDIDICQFSQSAGNVTGINNRNLGSWYHLTYTFNSTSSTSNLYLNNILANAKFLDFTIPNLTAPSKLYVGVLDPTDWPIGINLAYLAVWTGSILTDGQITTLNNEYKLRYPLSTT